MRLDVTDADQLVAALDQAEAEFGIVTILINNAGMPDAQRAHKMSVELIDAVIGTNEVVAVEWARYGINVNGIAPGAFSSEMMDGMIERIGDLTPNLPRQRLGDPAQLDSTLLYLVAPSSEFVTGTVIKVDDRQGSR